MFTEVQFTVQINDKVILNQSLFNSYYWNLVEV